MIEVLRAPPLATVQDRGFAVGTAWGLPPSGAMDPAFLGLANQLVGNEPEAAALEWSLGPLVLRTSARVRVSIVGLARVQLNQRPLDPPRLGFTVPAGSSIAIEPDPRHRFSYAAFAGGIAVPEVLGSRSTYLPGSIGGHRGRRLQVGDRLTIGREGEKARRREVRTWPEIEITISEPAEPVRDDVVVRVTRGPQWDAFEPESRAALFATRFTVSPSSDRMGYRLLGGRVLPRDAATRPSEPVCPGAIQIPDSGEPIVVMPDGPTVGGYPKPAVVVRADLRLVAQCPSDRGIRFREVSLEEARACYSLVR